MHHRFPPRLWRSLVAGSMGAAAVVALVLAESPAAADEAAPARAAHFGDRGTFAFGGNVGFGSQYGLGGSYETQMSLELDLGVEAFVARRLSLGAATSFMTTLSLKSPASSHVSVSPRVGYAVPLGGSYVLWPRASLDFTYGTENAGSPSQVFHHRIVSTSLYAPVDALLLPHVLVGVGPEITQQLRHATELGTEPLATTARLFVEIAGWF